MPPQFVHVIGIEDYIGIDPHQFAESLCEGIAGHLVARGVDGGVAMHAPDGIAAPLQFAQGILAAGIDGTGDRHENDTAGCGGHEKDSYLQAASRTIIFFPGPPELDLLETDPGRLCRSRVGGQAYFVFCNQTFEMDPRRALYFCSLLFCSGNDPERREARGSADDGAR